MHVRTGKYGVCNVTRWLGGVNNTDVCVERSTHEGERECKSKELLSRRRKRTCATERSANRNKLECNGKEY